MVGISHIEVTLSKNPIKISATQLVDGMLSPGLFYVLHWWLHNKMFVADMI